MIAYMVHDLRKNTDLFILPEMGCAVAATPDRFETFISPFAVFAKWSGDACGDLAPEDFGTIVATRDDRGDVCIVNDRLWQLRMEHYSMD